MSSKRSTSGSTFYCHSCADKNGLLTGLHLTSTSPSTYQLDKAVKHTNQNAGKGYNSVLNSNSTADIELLSEKALNEGFIEIESCGFRSLIYQSTNNIGVGYDKGIPKSQQDSFRWVLSSDASKAHGYTVESKTYETIKCSKCGTKVTT